MIALVIVLLAGVVIVLLSRVSASNKPTHEHGEGCGCDHDHDHHHHHHHKGHDHKHGECCAAPEVSKPSAK